MVDYSKWNKFGDDDEEEEEEDEREKKRPGVYRIPQGGSVTIPGRNVTIHSKSDKEKEAEAQRAAAAAAAAAAAKEKQAKDLEAKLTRNGGKTDALFWSQTRDSVSLGIFCDSAVKVWRAVEGCGSAAACTVPMGAL